MTPPVEYGTALPPLRTARPDDLDAVVRLLSAAALPTAGVAELLAAHARDVLVADDPRHPGELAAVVALEVRGDTALLRSVAVAPAWRTHGLGRAVVDGALQLAEGRELRALYLLTTTAEHYFPKFGFERIDRDAVPTEIAATQEFRSTCPASAVAMRRVMTHRAPREA